MLREILSERKIPRMDSYIPKHSYILGIEELMSDLTPESWVYISTLKDYKEAREAYEEFKKRRAQLGKPLQKFIDPDAAQRDLQSDEFLTTAAKNKGRK